MASVTSNTTPAGGSVDGDKLRWKLAPEGWSSDDEALEPEKKKLKHNGGLSLCQRFHRVSEEELDSLIVAKPPTNMAYATKWAVRNFREWMNQRNSRPNLPPTQIIPENVLESGSTDDINHWLSLFVVEMRNKKGQPYPPKTLYQLTGLHRHAITINPQTPHFLNKGNSAFLKLHNVIDNHFKALRKEGVGSEAKHTEIITKEEENKLWTGGILGLTLSPKALLRTIFFYNGKNFCLRGGAEHRGLKLSQFTRCSEPEDDYIYTENSSKNRQGGIAQLRIENKVVPIFSNATAGDRCQVQIMDTYISKLPKEVKENDFFYARPLPAIPTDIEKPWFAAVPVGKNTLNTMLKDMCHEAAISGHKTNHSLRATGASELFAAGVPEKIIKERTGHRSLEALHVYEHTTSMQHQAVSSILGSREKVTFQEALLTPTVSSCSASASSAQTNVFNNCSVQVIQTTQAPQLPPLPPPQPLPTGRGDLLRYVDQVEDFDLEEFMHF